MNKHPYFLTLNIHGELGFIQGTKLYTTLNNNGLTRDQLVALGSHRSVYFINTNIPDKYDLLTTIIHKHFLTDFGGDYNQMVAIEFNMLVGVPTLTITKVDGERITEFSVYWKHGRDIYPEMFDALNDELNRFLEREEDSIPYRQINLDSDVKGTL